MSTPGYGWQLLKTNHFINLGPLDNWRCQSPIQFTSAICDDKCYTWNVKRNSISVADSKDILTAESVYVEHKEWRLNVPITFEVDQISVKNYLSVHCLLWGVKGVAVAQVPPVSFQSEFLKARCEVLGEYIHVECSKLKVIQAKMSLDSSKKVVAVLYNDKYLRIYDINGEVLVSLCVGPLNSIPLEIKPLLEENLLESPVDFDLGPYLPKSKFWTVFVLRATGTITYTLVRILDKTKKCITEAHRPISIGTKIRNDLGELATGVLCTQQFPIILVITTNKGVALHAVLLPEVEITAERQRDYDQPKMYNIENKMLRDEMKLCVRERLQIQSSDKEQTTFTKLVRDPLFDYRYLLVHDFGTQLVTIRFASEIVEFFKEQCVFGYPGTLGHSTVRNLLRWSLSNSTKTQKCLLTATFSDSLPQSLLFILGDHKCIRFGLPDTVEFYQASKKTRMADLGVLYANAPHPNNPARHFNGYENILDTCNSYIQKSTIPPLILGDQTLNYKELRKMLTKSVGLVMDHIRNLNEASVFATLFVDSLEPRTHEMSLTVSSLLEDKTKLKQKAEILAEKYEERVEADELLQKRLQKVMLSLSQSSPVMTDKEKLWLKSFETFANDNIDLKSLVDGLKGKHSHMENNAQKVNGTRLSSSQLKQIKFEVSEQHQSLYRIITGVNRIMENLPLQ